MNGLYAIGVRSLAERKGRCLLTAGGIVLGVALFVGALIAATTTSTGVDRLGEEASGLADVFVSPAGGVGASLLNPGNAGAMTTADLAALAALPDVAAVAPSVGFPTSVRTPDGRGTAQALQQLGTKPTLIGLEFDDGVFPVEMLRGRLPGPGASEFALPDRIAADLGAAVGDTVTVATPTGDHDLLVTGVLAESGLGRLNRVAVASIDTVRQLAGRGDDAVTLAGVRLDPAVTAREWIAANADLIGPGLAASPAAESIARFRDQLVMLSTTITVLAATVLFSAGFLIYLTLSMSVVERTRLYGTLQALGATRAQIRRVVLTEAFSLGLAASILGVAVGIGVAMLLNTVTARTLALIGSPPLSVPPWALMAGVLFGVATTLVFALVPAGRAARLDPIAAIRDTPTAQLQRRTLLAGVVLAGAGVTVMVSRGDWLLQVVAVLAVVAGAVLLVRPVIQPVAAVMRSVPLLRRSGTRDIAVVHLAKEPARSGATLALVMVVMAVTFACGALTLSYIRSLDREIERSFGNDLTLFAASSFAPEFVAAVEAHPVVERVSARGSATSHLHDGEDRDFVFLQVIDPATYFDVSSYLWVDGDDATARNLLERGRAVILPGAVATRLGVGPGGHVVLDTAAGSVEFEVAALAQISDIPPTLVTGARDGRELFDVSQPHSLAVNLARGVPVEEGAAVLERDLSGQATFIVATSDDVRADVRAQILGIANGFFVLLLLAGMVGLFGMANTLAVSVIQRSREIAVLRAIGARRRQVGGMAVVEALTMVLIAFVLAVPLGALISGPLMGATREAIGDFDAAYVFPWLMVPAVAAVALTVGGVAALWPARRAATIEIDTALRLE